MAKVTGLLVLLCLSLLASAQEHNKELLQGTWILSGVRSIPSFVGYRSNYNSIDSFKTVKILNDSFMKMEFNKDTLTVIKHQTYNKDTQDYQYELDNDGCWLKTWPIDKKKKNKHKKRVRLNYVTNESMMISESFFNSATSLSTFIRTELYFNREVPLHGEKERNRLAGTWHVSNTDSLESNIWRMDTIILKRQPKPLSKTYQTNSYGDTVLLTTFFHQINIRQGLLIESIESEDVKLKTTKQLTTKSSSKSLGYASFESFTYPHTAIKHPSGEFTKIIHSNSVVELWPHYETSEFLLFKYQLTNDTLTLHKLQY